MKKRLLAISLLAFSLNAQALSAAHSSTHSVAHESVSAHVAESAHETIAYRAAIYGGHAGHVEKQQLDSHFIQNEIPKGVLTCDAAVRTIGSGHQAWGCRIPVPGAWSSDEVSIQQYFDRLKGDADYKITMIIYDSAHQNFEIYYS